MQLTDDDYLSFSTNLNIAYCLPNIFLPFVLNALLGRFRKGLRFLFIFGVVNAFLGHLLFLFGLTFHGRWTVWIGYGLFGIGSECITMCCLSYTNDKYLGTPHETLCISITTFSCDIANYVCFWVSSGLEEKKISFLTICWFSVLMCLISIISVIFILTLFPAQENNQATVDGEKQSISGSLHYNRSPFYLLRSKSYWLMCLAYLLQNQTRNSGSMKLYQILETRFGFTTKASQRTISSSYLAGALIGPFTGYILDRLIARYHHATKLHLSCMFITSQIVLSILVAFYFLDRTTASFWPIPGLVLFQISGAFFSSSFWSFIANFLQYHDCYFGYSFLSAFLNLFCIVSAEICTEVVMYEPSCTYLLLYMLFILVIESGLVVFLLKRIVNK